MAGSESLYGEGHPATYDLDDSENPLYDPESKWYDPEAAEKYERGLGSTAIPKKIRIEFSGEFYGDNPEDHGVLVNEEDLFHKNNPEQSRDS